MVSDKTIRYANRNMNLPKLSERIVENLKRDGYETQKAEGFLEILIQARKESVLKDLAMSDRCLTILLLGQPDDFSVRVGIGWCFNLTSENVDDIISSGVFLGVTIPEKIWNENIENTIIKNIDRIIEDQTEKSEPRSHDDA